MRELIDLEDRYPELYDPLSPSQRVGGEPLKEFKEVKHPFFMGSLNNTYNEGELFDFDRRIKKILNIDGDIAYVSEHKYDGISIRLHYISGKLQLAATRGDGYRGDDVTELIKTVRSIPLILSKKIDLGVRGEVFIGKKEFSRINREREKEGLPLFANSRNATAGTLHTLDTKEVARRKLDSFIYLLEFPEKYGIKTHLDSLKFMDELGFKVNNKVNKLCKNIEEVIQYNRFWLDKRSELDYPVDGMVIKVNDLSLYEALGSTAKAPRWAIAYKFPAEQARTKLRKINIQVGRMGNLTPVAELEPVKLSGVTIKRASLYNFDYIISLDIREGDFVLVERAGEVIPRVIKPLAEYRTGKEIPFQIPDKCPICGGPIGKDKEEDIVYKCLNPECPEKVRRSIEFFVSKDAMNIENLGPSLIKQLIDKGLVRSVADIYKLTLEDLSNLERMADKSSKNVIDSINQSKNRDFWRIVYALGIPGVGSETAKLLAKHFKNIDNLIASNYEELVNIKGIGKDTAKKIEDFFSNENNLKLIKELKEAGLNFFDSDFENEGRLGGKVFCITGTFENYKRNDIKEIIEKNGGSFSPSVSKKIDYLIVGNKPGSKLQKAEKLGITFLSLNDFFKMIE